jgi:hypothetical protein
MCPNAISLRLGIALLLAVFIGTPIPSDAQINRVVAPPSKDPKLLLPINVGKNWGYADTSGTVQIQPRYDAASPFGADGYAIVSANETYSVIDKAGTVVVSADHPVIQLGYSRFAIQEPAAIRFIGVGRQFSPGIRCTEIQPGISEGLFAIGVDGKWGFMNEAGEVVIKPAFESLLQFNEGLAAASLNGKWGFIDHSGNWAVAPRFDRADSFREGFAVVIVGDSSFHIRPNGQRAFNSEYKLVGAFSEGLAIAAMTAADLRGYIDKTGHFVIQPRFKSSGSFHEGLATVVLPGGTGGYIDHTGELRIPVPPEWHVFMDFNGGMAYAWIDDRIGYINRSGDWVFSIKVH